MEKGRVEGCISFVAGNPIFSFAVIYKAQVILSAEAFGSSF